MITLYPYIVSLWREAQYLKKDYCTVYRSILYGVMFSSLVVTEEHNFDFCAVTVIEGRGPQVSAGGPFAASNKLYITACRRFKDSKI